MQSQSGFEFREKPVRFIHPDTQLPCTVASDKAKPIGVMRFEEWHSRFVVYVNLRGELSKLKGKDLDAAIEKGKNLSTFEKQMGDLYSGTSDAVITDSEWREIHVNDEVNYSQNHMRYVDCLSGLPPVTEKGNLLEITKENSKPKIISGEWKPIRDFIAMHGKLYYRDSNNNQPTTLEGSHLQKALDCGLVHLASTKPKPRAQSEKKFRAYQPSFFTPQLPRPAIPITRSAPVLPGGEPEPYREKNDDLSSSTSQISVRSSLTESESDVFTRPLSSEEKLDPLLESLGLTLDALHPSQIPDLRCEDELAQLPPSELIKEIDGWLNITREEAEDMVVSPFVRKR